MGVLNTKDRILDVVLTDRGRKLLSQNLLDFEFYAFSDDGVDYSAALSASTATSGSVDDYIRRTITQEATQMANERGLPNNRDFSHFLYSVPPRRQTLPEFRTNFDDRPDVSVKRRFYIDQLILTARRRNRIRRPVAVIARTTVSKQTFAQRLKGYVLKQKIKQTESRLAVLKKNVTGQMIAPHKIMLNRNKVLDTLTGFLKPLGDLRKETKYETITKVETITVKKEIEVVAGLDRIKINLELKSSEGEFIDPSGYLVEVYESGSDGSLIKLIETDVEDVLEDEVLQKGFEDDLFLDVDASSADIISEAERFRHRENRRREIVLRRLRKNLQKKLKTRRKK